MNIRTGKYSIDEQIKKKYFHLCHFKGGSSTTTTRNIPAQTATEADLESGLAKYDETGLNNASNTLSNANSAISSTYNPDYSMLASNYNNSLASALSNYNNTMSGLNNGELPSSYATNEEKAINSELSGTMGNTISSLANRGILDSSVTDNALNSLSQNVSDSLAKNYTNDLSTASNLANSTYSNNVSNANNLLSGNESAQSSSYTQPSELFSYANDEYSPANSLFDALYNGRMGTSGETTTTSNSGKGSTWQALGTIGAAAIGKPTIK